MAKTNFTLRLINLIRDITQKLVDCEYAPSEAFRDFWIECRYHELLEMGKTAKEARKQTAEEFYLGDKSIQKIIYKL